MRTTARALLALAAGALLAGCSTVRLAYNNLPEIGYWWLDGYVDFNGAQSLQVKGALAGLQAWHRREELPKLAALLAGVQVLAPQDVGPQEACALADAIRERLLNLARQAEPAAAELALSLDAAQLQTLSAKHAKLNAAYRKDWLDLSREAQHDKRYRQLLERSEDFYGTLSADQRALLRQQVAQSQFSPQRIDTQRQRRQQDLMALLQRLNSGGATPAEARSALHDYVMRIAEPEPGPAREQQRALQQEGCRYTAALHNSTSAAQRERAVRRLRAYEDDLRVLSDGS